MSQGEHIQSDLEQIEVREQSFTFSKDKHSDNPETALSAAINQPGKNHLALTNQPKGEEQHIEVDLVSIEKIKQEPKTEEKSPSRKHSASFTPTKKVKAGKGDQNEHGNSDEEEGTVKDYKELTMKLQTALNKISGSKKGLNKTMSQSETVWRRFEECAERKKKDMQLKKKEREQIKAKNYKDKPTINKRSQKLAKEVGYEPIYTRFERLMEEKKKKEEQVEENKRKQKQIEEKMFQEELNKHRHKPEHVRSYDDYFQEMVEWKKKSQTQNRQKLQLKKAKELQGVTFTPVLNAKSKKMVASQSRLPIEQRGLMKKKAQLQYSFTPNLLKKGK